MQLFKTKGSSKLKGFLEEAEKKEEEEQKVPPGYISADELRKTREYFNKILKDAEEMNSPTTLHGSCELVRRQIEIYEEWEQKTSLNWTCSSSRISIRFLK